MSPRAHLNALMRQAGCTDAAPIFDPFSARVAEMNGWSVAKLSGSFAKFANVSAPDGLPLSTMTDLADICHRILRNTELALIADADEGGGNAVTLRATIRDLEMAGVAGIEIEDNLVPQDSRQAARRHALMVPLEEQIGKLQAALAARRDPQTVIIARSFALSELPRDEALARMKAYGASGAGAIMLAEMPGGMQDLLDVQAAAGLPLFVLGVPQAVREDAEFVAKAGLKLRFLPHRPFRAALAALDQAYKALQLGQIYPDPTLTPETAALIDQLCRKDDLDAWQQRYLPK